jgi:hypothetical protein
VDTVYQADKVWLLDIQRKLYTWSRSTPDDAWRDMWNWVTQPQNTSALHGDVSRAIAVRARRAWTK